MGISNSGVRAAAWAAGFCASLGVCGCPGAEAEPSGRGTRSQGNSGPVFAPPGDPQPTPGTEDLLPLPADRDAGAGPAGLAGFSGGTEPIPDAGSMRDAMSAPNEADASVSNPGDPHDALRTACVQHINMYRATLSLKPLVRASAEDERCSDEGAEYDVNNGAHQSVGRLPCRKLGAQNTCPGYPAPGGNVTPALTGCLDQMWDEGPPPVPVDECVKDYTNCFLPHGHYINMADPDAGRVSCGFFQMSNGRWWMNQDFGR